MNFQGKKAKIKILSIAILFVTLACVFGLITHKNIMSVSGTKKYVKATTAVENVISPNGNTTWKKSHTVTITANDGKYAIIKANGVLTEEKPYTKGQTITLSGETGKYSLQIVYQNSAGNKVSFISEPFYLDNSLTTVGSVNITMNTINGATYSTKLVTNQNGEKYYEGGYVNSNLYIHKVDGKDNESGHKSTVYTVSKILSNNTEIVIGNSSVEDTIIENYGTYKIVVTTEDMLGNKGTKTYLVHKGISSIVTFGTNGNNEYQASVSTKVTIDQNYAQGIKLYYAWAKEGETPETYTSFNNGDTISLKGKSGNYILWIKTVDAQGVESIVKSKVFHVAGAITNMGNMIFRYENENGDNYTPGTYSNRSIYLKLGTPSTDKYGGTVTTTYKITKKVSGSSEIVIGNYTNESTVLIQDGEYTVTMTSTNELGASSSKTYTVRIDRTGPSVTFTGVDNYVTTGRIGVTIVEDGQCNSEIDIANCRYYWTRNDKTPTYDDFFGVMDGKYRGKVSSANSTINTPAGESGIWCLWILAQDKVGNYTITKSITIEDNGNISRLDNTNPIAGSVELRENTADGKVCVEGSYTKQNVYIKLLNGYDADSGVKTNVYDITKSGSSYKTGLTAPAILTEHGRYVVTITTIDNNGNSSTRQTNINIDKKAPVITFIPNGKTEYSKKQEIRLTIDDEGYSGVNEESLNLQWIGYDSNRYKNIEEVLQVIEDVNNQYEQSRDQDTNKEELKKQAIEQLKNKGIYLTDANIKNGVVVTPENATGTYHLYVSVEDNMGNTETTISQGYLLDNTKPTVPEILAYKQNDAGEFVVYYGETVKNTVKIVAQNSESLSGVDMYQYCISKDNGYTWLNWANATMLQNRGEITLTEEGNYLVKVRAVAELLDGTLESEETDEIAIRIDHTGPAFTFANYDNGQDGTNNYVKKAMVRVTVTEQGHSIVNTNTLKYEWVKFESLEEYNEFKKTANTVEKRKAKMTENAKVFANGEELPSPDNVNGIYSLFAYAEDTVGNSNVGYSNPYRLGQAGEDDYGIYELRDDGIIRILPSTNLKTFLNTIKTVIKGSAYMVFDKEEKNLADENTIITTNCTLEVDGNKYKIAVLGDLNEDGALDIIDVSRMTYHMVGETNLEGIFVVAGDINNDGEVGIVDLSKMMLYVAKMIEF